MLNCASCVAILPDFVSGIVFGIVFDDYARKLRTKVTYESTFVNYFRKLRTKIVFAHA